MLIDGIGKVFTDANDTTPGFLNDEIIVDGIQRVA